MVVAHLKRVHAAWVTAGVGALVLELTVLYLRNPFAVVFGMLFGAALLAGGRVNKCVNVSGGCFALMI